MDPNHEHAGGNGESLPPEDLDALFDSLRAGSPSALPRSQRAEGEFIAALVGAARDARLDDGYAARLEKHLRHKRVHTSTPAVRAPWPVQRMRLPQSWRRMAVALSGATLMAALGLSSMVGAHLPRYGTLPTLPDGYTNGLYASYTLAPWHTDQRAMASGSITAMDGPSGALARSPSHTNIAGTTYTVQAVQAPAPPNTPLPIQSGSEVTPLGY